MTVWFWVQLTASGATVAAALIGAIRYWLRIRFLRHVFDRAGVRNDLDVAGRALAPHRWGEPATRTVCPSLRRSGAAGDNDAAHCVHPTGAPSGDAATAI